MNSQIFQKECAKAAAKRLFQKVNYTGGALQSYEVSSLLQETYEFLKISFKPTANDVKAFTNVLDVNGDGEVTLNDLESFAVDVLCGSGVLAKKNEPTINKNSFSFQDKPESYSYYQPPASYQSKYKAEYTYEFKDSYDKYTTPSSINYETSFYEKQKNLPTYTSNDGSQYSSSYSSTFFDQNQGQNQNQFQSQNQNQFQFQNQVQYQPVHDRQYSEQAMYYLEICHRIFERAADQSFTITERDVPDVLEETYEALGRSNYRPNAEDTKVWMKLCDTNGDGHVEYQDYENFVARSLERSGLSIYA